MNRQRLEAIAGGVVFVAFVAAHYFVGSSAAVKVLGLGCVLCGVVWVLGRSVPVGVEGREPSLFIRGAGAVIVGLAIGGLGALLLLYSEPAACMLGWETGAACG